jgi:hypothetical protein
MLVCIGKSFEEPFQKVFSRWLGDLGIIVKCNLLVTIIGAYMPCSMKDSFENYFNIINKVISIYIKWRFIGIIYIIEKLPKADSPFDIICKLALECNPVFSHRFSKKVPLRGRVLLLRKHRLILSGA